MTATAIVHQDPTLRIAVVKNLLINIWRDAPTVAQMRAFASAGRSIHRARPGRGGLLNAVLGGTPRFSDGVRDEAVKLTREPMLPRGVVHLIVVGGLAGSAARAFLSTIVLLGRPRVPTRVMGDEEQACTWLAPHITTAEEPWAPAELLAIYREVATPY